jgi:hypothetical protein
MNQEQTCPVGDKGGGIRRKALRIIGSIAPSCAVKDEVIKRIARANLVDQVQFPVENGYRAAGIAIEELFSHINRNVRFPTFALSVEGAVIQSVVASGSTVKAVQSVLELNQAGVEFGVMIGEDCVVAPAVIGRIHRPPQSVVITSASVHAIQKIAVLGQSRAVSA